MSDIGAPPAALKICHLVEKLENGAIENWLFRSLRDAKSSGHRIDWYFFCVLGKEGRLDSQAKGLGANIYHAKNQLSRKLKFLLELRKFLRQHRIDVLHSHHDLLSGFYFVASIGLPVRRVIHVHNSSQSVPVRGRWKQKILRTLLRKLSILLAHKIIAVSKPALAAFVRIPIYKRDSVVYLGIDTAAFEEKPVIKLREQLSVSGGTKILLFVGRLVPEKNPLFFLDVLSHLLANRDDIIGVVAGDGPLARTLLSRAERHGIAGRVKFVGFRNDVPSLMQQASLLVVPTPDDQPEGLGLVVVEAQAAGLRSLVSKAIPPDAVIVPELVTCLPVSEGPSVWAGRATELLDLARMDQNAAFQQVGRSPFGANRALSNLFKIYTAL